MAKKVKLSDLRQLDIISALRGESVPIEDVPVDTGPAKSGITPWTFIDDIRKFKRGNLLDDEQNYSVFNSFIIMRFLSMKHADVFILNYFNEFASAMTKEQMYAALIHFIPKDAGFYKIIKNIKDEKGEFIEFIAKYYECSQKEAQEYLEIMGDDWAKMIKEKFGDFV